MGSNTKETTHVMKTSTVNKIVTQITGGVFSAADTAVEDMLKENPRALKLVKKLLNVAEDMVQDEFPVHVVELQETTQPELTSPATVENFTPSVSNNQTQVSEKKPEEPSVMKD